MTSSPETGTSAAVESVETLLGAASSVLNSTTADRNRVACWLTRTALEAAVDELLAAKGLDVGRASMRSKLTCLQSAYDGTDLPARADYAWSRLSEACHQHAYELSPTAREAEHLLDVVAGMRWRPTSAYAEVSECEGDHR